MMYEILNKFSIDLLSHHNNSANNHMLPIKIKPACIFILLLICSNIEAKTWYEYQSQNFIVFSDRPPKKIKKLIRELEDFRIGILKFSGLDKNPDHFRAKVYLFGNIIEYKKIAPVDTVGFFYETEKDFGMVTSTRARALGDDTILFHEYVHFLLRMKIDLDYPDWYEEGLAELMSTAEIKKSQFFVGRPPRSRLPDVHQSELLPIPLEDLITPDIPQNSRTKIRRYKADFYAGAWVMAHYIHLGSLLGYPYYAPQANKYFIGLDEGEDPVEAFPKYFGKTIKQFSKELRAYKNEYQLKGVIIDITPYSGGIESQHMSTTDAAILRADIAWQQKAEKYLVDLLEEIVVDDNIYESKYFKLLNILLTEIDEKSQNEKLREIAGEKRKLMRSSRS